MIKFPSLEDLKKAGSQLVDSAKQIKFNEMLDKIKSGMESVSSSLNKETVIPTGDEAVKKQFKSLYTSLNELSKLLAAQATIIKNIENQVSTLGKIVEAHQTKKTTTDGSTTTHSKKKGK